MIRNLPNSKGTYLEKDLLQSEAFWDLTATAIKVFVVFRFKCVIKTIKTHKRNAHVILNNGEIQFTYIEAKRKYDISKSSFQRAVSLLIEVGIIEVAEYGGEHRPNLYSISENWRMYPEQNFKRRKSANLVGKNTRWKSKDTPNNDTI